MSKTPVSELSQIELDEELFALDQKGQQESKRFQQLWAEAEKRGML
jgi:hypothetical protein